jgi:hypothetical protein
MGFRVRASVGRVADALIATFRCDVPARRGALADDRRIVGRGEGGRVRTRTAYAFL